MTLCEIEFQDPQGIGEGRSAAAFAALQEAYQEARRTGPDEFVETRIVLAGGGVSVRTVGRSLATAYGNAFRHLVVPWDKGRSPKLTVELWEESATGVPCPRLVREVDRTARAEPDAVVTVGASTDRYVGHLRPGLCLWLDRQTAHLVGWAASGRGLSVQDRGKPLHVPLLVWHADLGVPVIHAGLVASADRGVLLVGPGGTGKTTAALACTLAGLGFLADDYVGLEQAGGTGFVGHSVYDSVWLTPDGTSRFPKLASHALPPERPGAGEKNLVSVFDAAPKALRRSVKIHAVLVATLVDEAASSIRSIPKARVLLAAAPTSMLRLPVSGKFHLDRLSRLIESVPSFELAVGRDASTLPPIVEQLVEEGDSS